MEAGEILLRKGLIDQQQLDLSRGAQAEGTRLDQMAVEMGFISEEAALRALGEEVGLEFVDLAETEVGLALLARFPAKFIHRESLFPIRQNNGTLVVATSDPFNLYPLDELSAATGLTVPPEISRFSSAIVSRLKIMARMNIAQRRLPQDGRIQLQVSGREVDMGVEPFLVSSTVEAVMAQRLVRTLCPECKQPFHPNADELPADFPFDQLDAGQPLYRAVGWGETIRSTRRGRRG